MAFKYVLVLSLAVASLAIEDGLYRGEHHNLHHHASAGHGLLLHSAGHGNLHHGGHHDHHDDHHDAPAHYQFAYGVHDHKTGDIKEQEEKRDGHSVSGHYSLVEADGTRRVVHYQDNGHGFEAQVQREGHANHHHEAAHHGHQQNHYSQGHHAAGHQQIHLLSGHQSAGHHFGAAAGHHGAQHLISHSHGAAHQLSTGYNNNHHHHASAGASHGHHASSFQNQQQHHATAGHHHAAPVVALYAAPAAHHGQHHGAALSHGSSISHGASSHGHHGAAKIILSAPHHVESHGHHASSFQNTNVHHNNHHDAHHHGY